MVFPSICFREQGFELHKTSRKLSTKLKFYAMGGRGRAGNTKHVDQQTRAWPPSCVGHPPSETSKFFLLGRASWMGDKSKLFSSWCLVKFALLFSAKALTWCQQQKQSVLAAQDWSSAIQQVTMERLPWGTMASQGNCVQIISSQERGNFCQFKKKKPTAK